MNAVHVTLDVGNSSCKLRGWRIDPSGALSVVARGEFALDDRLVAGLEASVAGATVATWVISCVAGDELEQRLVRGLERRPGEVVVARPDCGLRNDCREPAAVGRDRLYAARGAFQATGGPALVIDIGTAVTVDALLVESAEGRAVFAGGAIAPGPKLLAKALAQGTARLPWVECEGPVAAVGRDTRAAIASGVFHGLRGAVRELATLVSREAGIERAPWVVTGGAAEMLRAPQWVEQRDLHFDGDLVHIGLLCAASDRSGPSAGATRRHAWRR
ncbi:MAG: type III pantothenate kinase [Planctomycetes bacterium]|nr:type III pantothenate kinase [Planctomycetota bacterium]